MPAVDLYAPCPCGSGQKFKWCCHKAEPYAEKAERLAGSGQLVAAMASIDEGLKKFPDNAWLLTRKALVAVRQGKPGDARAPLEEVLKVQRDHLGAHSLLVRVALETEGAISGVDQLQQALTMVSTEARPALGPLTQLVGVFLSEAGHVPSSLKHLELAEDLQPDAEQGAAALRMVEGNPGVSIWLRNRYHLSLLPQGLPIDQGDRYAEALTWADKGLWAAAAATFETLAADGIAPADRNLGLCRLWLADDEAAVPALRRSIAKAGTTDDAVDLEALCQLVAPPTREDLVDHVHMIWPLKQHDVLIKALNASDRVHYEGKGPMDPDDPESFEVDQFALLSGPKPSGPIAGKSPGDLPHVVGHVVVGAEIAILDAVDDGRLDGLARQLTALAGAAIPPAHPKTKTIDKVLRSASRLQAELWLPDDAPPAEAARLQRLERARVVAETWPETPLPALGGKTPRQSARAGGHEIALLAAIRQLEVVHIFFRDGVDFAGMRRNLGIKPAEEQDPLTADLDALHLSRLADVPADRLDDDRLVKLWTRSRTAVYPLAMERSGKAVVERPTVMDRPAVSHVTPYSDLANLALSRMDNAEAFEWIARGRREEPAEQRAANAVRWDMIEVRLRARSEAPDAWVPHLAIVLERYKEDRAASAAVLSNLVDMGLVQMQPNPDRPGEVILDTRALQAVMQRYGPKITTAGGQLGVSAARGEIWTPSKPAPGAGGGIWTPGASSKPAEGGDKPRLIIPGR